MKIDFTRVRFTGELHATGQDYDQGAINPEDHFPAFLNNRV
jgi:hypothetical protein